MDHSNRPLMQPKNIAVYKKTGKAFDLSVDQKASELKSTKRMQKKKRSPRKKKKRRLKSKNTSGSKKTISQAID